MCRHPIGKGKFYPWDEVRLRQLLDDFLIQEETVVDSRPRMLLVPHSEYHYCGAILAAAAKQLKNYQYKRLISIGQSHKYYFKGAIIDKSTYLLPFGKILADKKFIRRIVNKNYLKVDAKIHKDEHSIEVSLVFLQYILGNTFKLVPILIGSDSCDEVAFSLADSLADAIDEDTLIILSSDLSRYSPKTIAQGMDNELLNSILRLDVDGYLKLIYDREDIVECRTCGPGVILCGILLAKKLNINKVVLLKYGNQGDVSTQDKKVIGYAACAFL